MEVHTTSSIDLIGEALDRRPSVRAETLSIGIDVQDDQRPDPLRTAALCWSIDRDRECDVETTVFRSPRLEKRSDRFSEGEVRTFQLFGRLFSWSTRWFLLGEIHIATIGSCKDRFEFVMLVNGREERVILRLDRRRRVDPENIVSFDEHGACPRRRWLIGKTPVEEGGRRW